MLAWLATVAACTGAPQPLPERRLAAVPGQLIVTDLPRATTLTIADLEALGSQDVPWTFRDEQHVYRAVALDRVLTHCGFEEGPGGRSIPPTERRPGWRDIGRPPVEPRLHRSFATHFILAAPTTSTPVATSIVGDLTRQWLRSRARLVPTAPQVSVADLHPHRRHANRILQ